MQVTLPLKTPASKPLSDPHFLFKKIIFCLCRYIEKFPESMILGIFLIWNKKGCLFCLNIIEYYKDSQKLYTNILSEESSEVITMKIEKVAIVGRGALGVYGNIKIQ